MEKSIKQAVEQYGVGILIDIATVPGIFLHVYVVILGVVRSYLVDVLLSSGCDNKISYIDWLVSTAEIYFSILEARHLGIRVSVRVVFLAFRQLPSCSILT